jgi:hypothetical protein
VVTSLRVFWWALTAALAAVVLCLWHAVLMKEVTFVTAGWIGLAWLLIAAARACERRGQTAGVAGVPSHWSRRTTTFWSLLAVFSTLLLLFHVGFERAASDGRGYFAQLNSLVIDRDLDFRNNIDSFGARRADAAYPLGTALLWTPFFLAAHAWLGIWNLFGADFPRDGYWNPYARVYGHPTLSRYDPNRGTPLFSSIARRNFGISTDPPPANHPIHIIVKNGDVTLEGAVDTEGDKTIAGLQANSTPGAFSVTNNLVARNAGAR